MDKEELAQFFQIRARRDISRQSVQLDRPDLGVTVYWLGMRFDPDVSGELPSLRLGQDARMERALGS